MPLSKEEEKKIRRKEWDRRYREKHKEAIAELNKEWREKNKEKIAEYNEEYMKEYYEKNKEKILEKQREYFETENGKKSKRSHTIRCWKKRGLIVDDYNIIYDRWLISEKCEMCDKEYKMTKGGYLNKCMEHNHTTGEFRSICCNSCNTKMLYLDEEKK